MCEAVSANAKEEFAWELSPRWHPVDFRVRCHLSTMLRPVYASARCCLLPAVRRTRPRITLALRCSQVHTPAPPTPTAINQANALPLSEAQRNTIYALSTPSGKSGIAVIRISGPDALCVWQRMVRPVRTRARTHDEERMRRLHHRPEPQKLERCYVVDPQTAEHLDDALAVFFRGASPS
jgi:GTP-binding protein TrmE N-terminus